MLLIWILIGTSLLIFARGRWVFPIAGWIAPAFLLHGMRMGKISMAILTCIGAHAVAGCISYQGSIPLSGALCIIAASAISIQYIVPYIINRLFYHTKPGVLSTLIFPAAYAAWEYILAQPFHPFPTFGSIAYTQFGVSALTQVISVTGIWGLIFIVTWFSSLLNWTWENESDWKSVSKGWLILES